MNLSFEVYKHVDDLPNNWYAFADKKKCMQAMNLGVQDRSGIPNLENFYLMASQQNEIVFIAYYQLLHVKPIHFNLGDKKFQQFWLDMALKMVKPTLLVTGNLFRHDIVLFEFSDTRFSTEIKSKLYIDALNFMIDYTNASGIFLKDVPKEIAEGVALDKSYLPMQDDISMEINIPNTWHHFEDYEKELKHKYLQRCKKIKKSFVGVKVRELNEQEIFDFRQEIFSLYEQVTHKQIVSMGKLNEDFFVELKRGLKENYRMCGFFLDDKMIAFSSAILHDGEYDMNYIGIDYAYNSSHQLYFNILFHCLESAIASGSENLILGRTAIEAKAIVGCTPDYRFSFYKLRNVIVNWFYQRVSKYFSESQGDHWKERHPFKSTFYS